ncbi:DUF4173 domain-containing protein [Brevibacillus choshinensis]|uniref:DUF4173 domain-containing protein n=2 Tax=Brevibacillus choshinensis TaxID=54911 RepID=A0ABX7FMG1_BRECH|nr:DUF4173 domain-containing protein [Brevibacillus choshinensis]
MAEMAQRHSGFHWMLIGSVAMGVIADYLFYGKEFGISYPLFVIGLYLLFIWQARERIQLTFSRDQAFAWSLTVPIFLLALTFFLYDNAFFQWINFMMVPFLLVAQTMLLAKRHQKSWFSFGFFGEMIETVLIYTVKYTSIPFVLLREWVKNRVDRTKYGVAMKVLAGLGISVPLLVVVLSLLSQADGVFGHFLAEIPRRVFDWGSAEAIFRLFLIGFAALLTFGYLYAILGPRLQTAALPLQDQPEEKKIAWDGIILVTILTIINVVYVAFTVIQISYLFGGAEAVLPDNMTYAEYAKKGFNELVTVTIINFILLVSFMHLVSRAQRVIYKIVQALLSLLTVCTSFMLVSAYYRLSLYEEAYGYTHTRLLAHAFMIFLFILFVIAFLKIWRNNFSLLKVYGVAGIAAYVLLNYINVDAVIAKKNIQRYEETGRIDVAYLTSLSLDAIPVIMTLKEDPAVADKIKYLLQERAEELKEDRGWQSFHLAKHVAKSYLE